jgi:hypothetical protein
VYLYIIPQSIFQIFFLLFTLIPTDVPRLLFKFSIFKLRLCFLPACVYYCFFVGIKFILKLRTQPAPSHLPYGTLWPFFFFKKTASDMRLEIIQVCVPFHCLFFPHFIPCSYYLIVYVFFNSLLHAASRGCGSVSWRTKKNGK